MDQGYQNEIKYLNSVYERGENSIQVLYGNTFLNSRLVLNSFFEGKNRYYYRARSASERMQMHLWSAELRTKGKKIDDYPELEDIFKCLEDYMDRPLVLVIGCFEKFLRSCPDFVKKLGDFVYNDSHVPVMVILLSVDVGWVENRMVDVLGEDSHLIKGIIKFRELEFRQLRDYYRNMSFEDAVLTYSILGGKSKLWRYFEDGLSFRENLCKYYLNEDSYMYGVPLRIISQSLRETEVYNTILYELAHGNNKLNDLYHATGYSRAKIMVYLKNLIGLEIVEKVYSFSTSGRENVQKGVYRITDPSVHFYFCFVFPYQSAFSQMDPEKYYDLYISGEIQKYAEFYFRKICRQFILRCDEMGRLPIRIEEEGEWVGKQGNIDIIARSETGDTILGICSWRERISLEHFNWLENCCKKAHLKGDYFYLFSVNGFTDDILELAAKDTRILLLGPDELQI